MTRTSTFTILLGIGSILLGACGAAPKKGEALMESVMTYNDGIRWDRLAAAASRVPPAERDDFVDERDQLADTLRITDWEVVRVRQGGDGGDGDARVHVKYTWYLDDEGVVRETHAEQRWAHRGKVWLIVDERRLRGDEMPGLAEPDPAADDAGAAPRDPDPREVSEASDEGEAAGGTEDAEPR